MTEFTKETMIALKHSPYPEVRAAVEQLDLMMGLLVESWDALALTVTNNHLLLCNISPSLIDRIEAALEPWATGEEGK
jgi:hypothetical protein